MKIDILTLFPSMFAPLEQSIIKRARDKKVLDINLIDFRAYSKDKHKKVDDYSFSGGAGLVLAAQPIVDCIEAIDPDRTAKRIFMAPAAPVLTQEKVKNLAKQSHLIILCGHYEGVDQRAIDLCFDEVISIGDYVLTGGELPAMVLVDAVARYVEGVINSESLKNESFSASYSQSEPSNNVLNNAILLEHPQYTRPREFRGMPVPEVLLGGNHAEIEKWKKAASIEVTRKYRPELLLNKKQKVNNKLKSY